jgi:uroporphyrinogen-III synthase
MEERIASRNTERISGFMGRTVLSLESRRAAEIATLIESYCGRPVVAPATREVPANRSDDVSRFAAALLEQKIQLMIFLTGVGTRALAKAMEPFCEREKFIAAVSSVPVVARGPKPAAALRELGIPITWNVPEPNTWREILQVLDANHVPLEGRTVAIQEYGVPSKELIRGLETRGASVMSIHVYSWALPEDLSPLRNAIQLLLQGEIGIALFTAAVQVHHLVQVAEDMGVRDSLLAALSRIKIASIGPVTSEALAEYGLTSSLEPSHPKMGFLVREAAEMSS